MVVAGEFTIREARFTSLDVQMDPHATAYKNFTLFG